MTAQSPGSLSFETVTSHLRSDFREMPDLSLTLDQAVRFWRFGPELCRDALIGLTREGFLELSGAYYRRAEAR